MRRGAQTTQRTERERKEEKSGGNRFPRPDGTHNRTAVELKKIKQNEPSNRKKKSEKISKCFVQFISSNDKSLLKREISLHS